MSPPSGHRQATVQVSTFCRHRKERRCAAASHRPPTSCRRGRWTSADPAEKPRGLPLRWKRPGTADASRMSPWPPIITCDGFSPRETPPRGVKDRSRGIGRSAVYSQPVAGAHAASQSADCATLSQTVGMPGARSRGRGWTQGVGNGSALTYEQASDWTRRT